MIAQRLGQAAFASDQNKTNPVSVCLLWESHGPSFFEEHVEEHVHEMVLSIWGEGSN